MEDALGRASKLKEVVKEAKAEVGGCYSQQATGEGCCCQV